MEKSEKEFLNDILQELRAQSGKKKDLWDRFGAISTFLSTVVLAAAGLYFTNEFNERQGLRDFQSQAHQARVLEMQTVEKFIPHLTGNEETKKIALLAITSLGSPEFATRFAQLSPSKGTEAAADQIMRTAQSSEPSRAPEAVLSKANAEKDGWAYLGHFVAADGIWKTRYFEFADTVQPAALTDKTLTVREQTGALNVRSDMPTPAGSFKPVIGSLKTGSTARILEIREWQSSGYIWAKISYGH